MMTFNESIQNGFMNYAEFSGRASRPEFWWWTLFVVLISVAGEIIGHVAAALVTLGTLLPTLGFSHADFMTLIRVADGSLSASFRSLAGSS
jgi:uncharacterized membrane protein YhaH (DUF805 family)